MSTRQQQQAQRIDFQERIIRSQNWTSCFNCEYWNKEQETCQTFNARPPLAVVVVGCPEWEGEFPF